MQFLLYNISFILISFIYLLQIQPLAGPLEGGTLVVIEGSNLGLKKDDVQGRVFIGDVPCNVEDYHVSVRIVCRTGPAPRRFWGTNPDNLQFPVRVTTPAGTTESTVKFSYTVSYIPICISIINT